MTVEFIKLLYMLQRKQDNSEAHLWQKLKHKSDRPFNSVAAVCSLPDPLCVCARLRPPAGAAVLGWRRAAEFGGPWRDVATDGMRGWAGRQGRPCAE